MRSGEMKVYELHEDILFTLFQFLPLKDIFNKDEKWRDEGV